MLCSNCGYENPREHRYCGMCGTPFPYRALTVPEAQSTLAFGTAPLEVAALPLPPQAGEPVAPTIAEPSLAVAEPVAAVVEAEVPEAVALAVESQAIEAIGTAVAEPTPPEPAPAAMPAEVPAEVAEAVAEVPEPIAEVVPEVAPEVEVEAPVQVESASDEPAALVSDEQISVVQEAAEQTQPVVAEAEPAAAEAAPEPVIEQPAAEVHKPAARVVVMPSRPPYHPRPEPTEPAPAKPIVLHPSPDAQTFTPPPASAGMPTFQEVAEAAGTPAISPFEPPAEKHTDEDRELEEYVASFRYTPPAETADELTMRSEAPVIDEAAPAEFHHPSFDNDVPPPPEAGPHPTGQEYYSPTGRTERPHFLEITDTPAGTDKSAFPAMLGDEVPPAAASTSGKRWLWTTIAAIIVLFGGLGFWEGRAQSTHAFRGPAEVVRDTYNQLRERLAQANKPSATIPEGRTPDRATLPEVKPAPAPGQSA